MSEREPMAIKNAAGRVEVDTTSSAGAEPIETKTTAGPSDVNGESEEEERPATSDRGR